MKSVYRGLAIVILIIAAGCNGVKTVGNSVETHGGLKVTVSDEYRYVDTITCSDFGAYKGCQTRSINYRADLYVKDASGEVEAVCVVISKSATGSSWFYYDRGHFFDFQGVRFSEYFNQFDLMALEENQEVAACVKALQRHGLTTDAEEAVGIAITKRIDARHYVVIGYMEPQKTDSDNMSDKMKEGLRRNLSSTVTVAQGL